MKITDYLDTLIKRDESLTVMKCCNGYLVEVTGRDEHDDWTTLKIVCNSMDEVVELLAAADKLEINR